MVKQCHRVDFLLGNITGNIDAEFTRSSCKDRAWKQWKQFVGGLSPHLER